MLKGKMMLRMIVFLCIVFLKVISTVFAAPSPLGFELGKAKLEDIEKEFRIRKWHSSDNDPCNGINTSYDILNHSLSNFPGLVSVWFRVDKDNIVQGFSMTIQRRQLESISKSLSEKYKFVKEGKCFGCKQLFFSDEGCEILLVWTPENSSSSINIYYKSPIDLEIRKKCQKLKEEKYREQQKNEKHKQRKML